MKDLLTDLYKPVINIFYPPGSVAIILGMFFKVVVIFYYLVQQHTQHTTNF